MALGWFIRAAWMGSDFMVAIVLVHMVQVSGPISSRVQFTWVIGVFSCG